MCDPQDGPTALLPSPLEMLAAFKNDLGVPSGQSFAQDLNVMLHLGRTDSHDIVRRIEPAQAQAGDEGRRRPAGTCAQALDAPARRRPAPFRHDERKCRQQRQSDAHCEIGARDEGAGTNVAYAPIQRRHVRCPT